MRLTTDLRILLIAVTLIGALGRPAAAATEWVLILDNSTSMSDGSQLTTTYPDGSKKESKVPPADPHRLAVIATLIFRSFLEADDRLTILVFDHPNNQVGLFRVLDNEVQAIRGMPFNQGTFFTGPLMKAREILEASNLPKKVLLLVTDGAPGLEDAIDAEQAKKLLGYVDGEPPFEVLSLGLATDAHTEQEQRTFLAPLGRLEQIKSPAGLVDGFTRAYADSIRSRPESGTLAPGDTHTFRAPKYVSDVMIALATVDRTGVFDAKVDAAGRQLQAIDGGDSGCTPPRTPCHAYQVFKAKKDPSKDEQWSISLPSGRGQVAFGIILRYELGAEIVSMSEAKVGEEKEVIARLTWQGAGFNDPAFFTSDDFAATLVLDGNEVPMELRPDDGSFAGKIVVTKPGSQSMVARFSNKWLTVAAAKPFNAEAWLPLTVTVAPNPIDFGSWTGGRTETERCVDLDFTGSVNVDKVPLEIFAKGLPDGFRLEAPSRGSTIAANAARVCMVAPGCCTDADGTGAVLVIRGQNEHYHPEAIEVPLAFKVAKTPFITCWWRVIAGIIGAIIFGIVAYGFIKPFDFDSQEVIRLASKENGLARAAGRRLRELPGGRRGFYRDARVAFDGTGGAVAPSSGASLVLKATKNDSAVVSKTTIEQKDPRTRKWVPVDAGDGLLYLRRGVVYRVGEFYFRIG